MNKRGNVLLFGLLGILVALTVGITGDQIMQAVFDSVNSALRANIVVGSGNISSIVSGITAINGGTDKAVCFDDGTTINCNNSNFTFNKNTNVGQLAGSSICTVANGLCGAAGSIGGSGTLNNYAIFTPNGTTIGNGNLIDNASGVTVQTASYEQQYTNNTGTGTTVNKLVKNDGTGKVIVASSSTDAVKGICVANCGTSGSAQVSVSGANVSCVFDNATTAGDYVQPTAAGGCHDAGSSFPTNVSVVGTVNTTNGGAGTYGVDLNGQDVAGATVAGGGGGRIGGSGTAFQTTYFTGTRTVAGTGPGTSGQVLTSNGAGVAPTYQAAAAGISGLTAGRVPVAASSTSLTDTANFTYDTTNFRINLAGGTSTANGATVPFKFASTLNASPSGAQLGFWVPTTSSNSGSAQSQEAMEVDLLANYTGTSFSTALWLENLAAGTGTTLNIGNASSTVPAVNFGGFAEAVAVTSGHNVGFMGDALGSSGDDIGLYGRASSSSDAGLHVGALVNADGSTKTGNFRNVGLVVITSGTTVIPSYGSTKDSGILLDTNGQDNINFFRAGARRASIDHWGRYISNDSSALVVGGSCGTSPTIVGGSMAGKITTGTGSPTSCTVTFASAWANAPACIANDETTAVALKASSTTGVLTISGTMTASDVVSFTCIGY